MEGVWRGYMEGVWRGYRIPQHCARRVQRRSARGEAAGRAGTGPAPGGAPQAMHPPPPLEAAGDCAPRDTTSLPPAAAPGLGLRMRFVRIATSFTRDAAPLPPGLGPGPP